jgi:uncharacterized protein YegL
MTRFKELGSLEENPTPRCLCTFIIDASDSMMGDKISSLHRGFVGFINDLKEDDFAKYSVELQVIIASGEKSSLSQAVTDVQSYRPPDSFQTEGRTPLGDAVSEALRRTNTRKNQYKEHGVSYYQPWIVILTDGVPTDQYKEAAANLRELVQARKITSFIVSVDSTATGRQVLQQFCVEGQIVHELKDVSSFSKLFKWFSASISQVSKSVPGTDISEISLPETSSWEDYY